MDAKKDNYRCLSSRLERIENFVIERLGLESIKAPGDQHAIVAVVL
jgi:hypothetical protein